MSRVFFDVYDFHFFMYDISGHASLDLRDMWHGLLYSVYHLILTGTLMLNNLMGIYLTYLARNDPKELMYLLTITTTTVVCSVTIFLMDARRNEVKELHSKLNSYLSTPIEWAKEMKANNDRMFALMTKAFYFLAVWLMCAFLSLPLFYPGERALPFTFPVKNLPSPYYEALYVYQAVVLVLFMINTISYDMICYGFLLRVSICLEIIAEGLLKFCTGFPSVDYSEYVQGYSDLGYNGESPDLSYKGGDGTFKSCKSFSRIDFENRQCFNRLMRKTEEFLKNNIRHHQEIMGVIQVIDNVYNFTVALRLLMGTAVFAIAASTVFSENFNPVKDIRLAGYAFGGFIDFFIYCYCGSRIVESDGKIAYALYALPWYEMDIKARKTILFALLRLRESKKITAGKIFKLNVQLFLKILKFAHSFITLFKNF